ncbi:MAG: chorismate-binding protein [Bacteroidia bacterium]
MSKAIIFYRLPGTNEIVKRNGDIANLLLPINFTNESEKDIFYIAPYNSGTKAYACILGNEINKFEIISYQNSHKNEYDSETDFIDKVNFAIDEMKQLKQISKVVLARCKKFEIADEINVNAYFLALCLNYPNAFVYAISSSVTGTWIAATPELLLKATHKTIETTAIAGTKLFDNDVEWGGKEIDEHHQVELFIEHLIQKYELELINKDGPKSIKSGHLTHLSSYYRIANKGKVLDMFLNELNPTPAVGGLPSKNAIDFILKNENLDRKFYTGFVGIKTKNLTQLFVNIRCMEIFKTHVNAYAGCGITTQSIAVNEWIETEYKLETVLKYLS